MILSLLILAVLLSLAFAEVTILKNVQTLYDRSPKLRIRGSGFDPVDDLLLSVSSTNSHALIQGTDFKITNATDSGITLRLMDEKVWVNLNGRIPPVGLILNKLAFKNAPDTNMLPNGESIILANILESPSIFPNDQHMFSSVTHELRINGTGFTGAKTVDLYFNPPIKKEIDYQVVSVFPITSDQVVLQLQQGGKWRATAGPLVVKALDTGGGPVAVGNVTVGNVDEDLDVHLISVENTAATQKIYHDDPAIIIKGKGFNVAGGNKLSFKNSLLGKGLNYTIDWNSATELHLQLTPGKFWRKTMDNLPGYLTVLAVDSNLGGGFVTVGPINAGKGIDVAVVFERPIVYADMSQKLFRTHSHTMTIHGTGFPRKDLGKVELKFDPPLSAGVQYSVNVQSRTEMTVTINSNGKESADGWRVSEGPLLVTKINTLGTVNGWVDFTSEGGGVQVANVVMDIDKSHTGGVEVFSMGEEVYQSFLKGKIDIRGTGFHDGMAFEFESNLKADIDYTLSVKNPNTAELSLVAGHTWRTDAGFLVVKSVIVDEKTYPMAAGQGVRVAVVLLNPTVVARSDHFHESQSKVLYIKGTGFTNVEDTIVVLRPTDPGSYKVVAVYPDTIRLQLLPGQKWLPDWLSLGTTDEDKSIPLQVSSVDCGAGAVIFDEPVTIGLAVKDRAGEVCDDSCDYAFDDVCDDGSESNYSDDWNYMDDDWKSWGSSEADDWGDYYQTDDYFQMSGCLQGTDCTDCGGIDSAWDWSDPKTVPNADDDTASVIVCSNDCAYASDGVCDDPRGNNYCVLGTDCRDCGPVGASNFTLVDDDGWFDDDDDYWSFNDAAFMDQTKGLAAHRSGDAGVVEEVIPVQPEEYVEAVILGVAYTVVLAVLAAIVLYFGFKCVGYDPYPAMRAMCNLGDGHSDIELGTTQRMEISPFHSDR